MGFEELAASLVVGVAGGLAAHWVIQLERGKAIAIALVLAATAGVLVSLLAPYTITSVTWCRREANSTHVAGRLGSTLFSGPPADVSVQVKVYEPGRGDPPMAGPASAAVGLDGRFSVTFPRFRDLSGYLINVGYPFGSLLGERWSISDFRLPPPEECREIVPAG